MVSSPPTGDVTETSKLTFKSGDLVGHDLVEDVVGAFQRLLRDDTGFLQQVSLDVGAGQLAGGSEVDTDELTLEVGGWGKLMVIWATGNRLKPYVIYIYDSIYDFR